MRVLAALVVSLTLPFGGVQWWGLDAAGHSLLVTGSPPTGRSCEFVVVDLSTLHERGASKRRCGRPPVSPHPMEPVVGSGRDLFDVPVSVAGKVVMRYEDASDTRPQYAWYGRSLWIYDVATSDGAEALRLDAHTGRLLQRTPMPKVYRPVMVANADGLWLDPAANGGIDGTNVAEMLHVGLDASRPSVVHRGGTAAVWMASSAHTVWFEQVDELRSPSIWRVDGMRAHLLAKPSAIGFAAAYGAGKLWELTCGVKNHLLRVDPGTGALTPVGQFPRTANSCDAPMTVAGGDLFVLEGNKLYAYR